MSCYLRFFVSSFALLLFLTTELTKPTAAYKANGSTPQECQRGHVFAVSALFQLGIQGTERSQ